MNYEKINQVLMRILEAKYNVKIMANVKKVKEEHT